mmetsp:Transcript_80251/g.167039  ORF Transcript_80251/g.167039 Transcript_80251/m.167039 type:complete len:406 (-) Transcript_80251:132-1349(-)
MTHTHIYGLSPKLVAALASFVIATVYLGLWKAPKATVLPVGLRDWSRNEKNAVRGAGTTNETDAALQGWMTNETGAAVLGARTTKNNTKNAVLRAPTNTKPNAALRAHNTNKTETLSAVMGARTIHQTDSYTIIMATFRRDNCLRVAIQHYLKCNMRELRIKWQDFNRSVPAWLRQVQSEHLGRLVIDVADADYLSSRFKVERVPTSAVFPVDDDVRHPCFYLRDGFRIWQRTPSQIVGFAPRRVVAGGGCYRLPSVWRNIYYPIINTMWVTKGAFLHRDYLKVYFSQDYAHLRNLVDGNLTGEDMLMSFIVALANPPGQRWPVTLLSRKSPDDKKCSTLALGNAGMAKRCNLLDYFFYVLGFPMEFTPFSEIYTYDKSRSIFVPLSDKLRMKWVLHGQSPIEPV